MSDPKHCVTCAHLLSRRDGPRTGVWYNLFCSVSPRERVRSPVTGKYGGEKLHYCRDINKGDCSLWAPSAHDVQEPS